MATATVHSHQRKTLLTNKNQGSFMTKDGKECHGRIRVEDILSKCQETNRDRVFEIDLHACKLTRIENCHSFPKLRILDLSCNEIKLIRALDKNLELKELKLYSNKITKVEGLESLKELCSLQLQDNNISKLGNGLLNLKKLKSLRLDCNEVLSISISEIAQCCKLTYLNVCQNKIEDISFLNCLPLLEDFYASQNKIAKVPDLGRCKKLQELDLSHNKITSISGINTLPVLSILRLEHNEIRYLDVSGVVKNLEELYLRGNQVSSVKKVPNQFPSLEILDISFNALTNLEDLYQTLQGLDTVRELNIIGNPYTGSSHSPYHQKCVKTLPGLEVLDGCPVKRPQSSYGKNRPAMRPVSASKILSTRLVEEQVSAAVEGQNSFESLISSRFGIVYDLLNKLPEKGDGQTASPTADQSSSRPGSGRSSRSQESPRPGSRCSNRARIQHAITFAEQHFDEN